MLLQPGHNAAIVEQVVAGQLPHALAQCIVVLAHRALEPGAYMLLSDRDGGQGLDLLLVSRRGARVLKLVEELCDDGIQAVGPPGIVHWVRVQDAPGTQAQVGDGGWRDDAIDQLLDDPFQCGDTLVPAGGSPGREAGTGLPGAMPVPGLMLSLPPALRVPAVIGLGPWRERGDLKAVIKDAKSELSVSLGQRE